MCNIKIYHSILRELYINTRNYAISHKTLVNKEVYLPPTYFNFGYQIYYQYPWYSGKIETNNYLS